MIGFENMGTAMLLSSLIIALGITAIAIYLNLRLFRIKTKKEAKQK